MHKNLVSIIVPVYNVERFLRQCVDSVIAQTYKEWELLLIDDESTDSSLTICKSYEREDHRIVSCSAPHLGASHARNMGLDLAKGEYVYFLDADDFMADRALETLVSKMEESLVDIVCAECQSVMEDGRIFAYRRPRFPDETVSAERMLKDVLTYATVCSVWSKLYKRETIGSTRFMEGLPMGEDIAFWTMLLYDKALEIKRVSPPLYFYRIVSKSISHSKDTSKRIENIKVYMERLQTFASSHASFRQNFRKELAFNMLQQVLYTMTGLQGVVKNVSAWHISNIERYLPDCEQMERNDIRLCRRILHLPLWMASAYMTIYCLPICLKSVLRRIKNFQITCKHL